MGELINWLINQRKFEIVFKKLYKVKKENIVEMLFYNSWTKGEEQIKCDAIDHIRGCSLKRKLREAKAKLMPPLLARASVSLAIYMRARLLCHWTWISAAGRDAFVRQYNWESGLLSRSLSLCFACAPLFCARARVYNRMKSVRARGARMRDSSPFYQPRHRQLPRTGYRYVLMTRA